MYIINKVFSRKDWSFMLTVNDETKDIDKELLSELEALLGCDPKEALFIDIETTGLSPKTSDIYLIGCGYFDGDTYRIRQFFAESATHEEEILSAFSSFAMDFKKLVHFNGDRFDIPFLADKYKKHLLSDPCEIRESLDIYKCVKPYKMQLGIPDCKQKTVELYLGIDREDEYSGGKLINVYRHYVDKRDDESLHLLLLHNHDDVLGMLRILPILRYHRFFSMFKNLPKQSVRTDEKIIDSLFSGDLPMKASKVQANYYKDYSGVNRQEVLMKLRLPFELPGGLAGNLDGCFFKADKKEATLRVPLFEEELKYFYSGYKDYYYLPREDMAIHKSLATFVDKDYRKKATPENCYTRKAGQYLMEWDLLFTPFFKRDYNDPAYFFDLNENLKQSRYCMSLYACHVMAHVLDL